MKHIRAFFLAIVLLLALTGCGGETVSSAAALSDTPEQVPMAKVAQNEDGYLIPETWTETSINDGSWGYVTSAVEDTCVQADWVPCTGGYYSRSDTPLTLTRYDETGKELLCIEIPPMRQEDGTEEYFGQICCGETDIWLIHSYFRLLDEETGESESGDQLEHWDEQGQLLLTVPLDEDFGIVGDNYVTGLALGPQGNPVVISYRAIYFLDGQGTILAQQDTGGIFYQPCRDRDGRLYLIDDNNTIYPIDWTNHKLDEALLTPRGGEQVSTGSGPYDLFLISDSTLRGVALETGTITELLSWADCGLSGYVSGVTWVDEETLLVRTYMLSSYRTLQVRRVPLEEVPEKTVVTMAVGLNPDFDTEWTDAVSMTIQNAVSLFNMASADYRIEAVTYTEPTELQTMMLGGDAPDLIYWNSDNGDDLPSSQVYAKRGYLVDLEPLIEQDADLSLEDFFPSVINLTRETYGGLCAMPTAIYFRSLVALRDHAEEMENWTYSDLLAIAREMPEDMIVMPDDQSDALDYFLEISLNTFVDMAAGTCNFETQEFYDLLTLCRDYIPQEDASLDSTVDYLSPECLTSGASLLYTELDLVLSHAFQLVDETIRPMEENGTAFVGYPSTGGNGFNLVFRDQFSICILGDQQEGAWQFLKLLYSYDFQKDITSTTFNSVRVDAYRYREEYYCQMYPEDCSPEELEQVITWISEADSVTVKDSPIIDIVEEEAQAVFNGDKTPEAAAHIIQNRTEIYLGEQN